MVNDANVLRYYGKGVTRDVRMAVRRAVFSPSRSTSTTCLMSLLAYIGTRVLQGCYESVSRIVQGCYKDVTRMLQGCNKGVTRMLQGCNKGVTRMLQGCKKGIVRASQGHHEGVTRALRGQYGHVTESPCPPKCNCTASRVFSSANRCTKAGHVALSGVGVLQPCYRYVTNVSVFFC
jgi:hypothetical protein